MNHPSIQKMIDDRAKHFDAGTYSDAILVDRDGTIGYVLGWNSSDRWRKLRHQDYTVRVGDDEKEVPFKVRAGDVIYVSSPTFESLTPRYVEVAQYDRLIPDMV